MKTHAAVVAPLDRAHLEHLARQVRGDVVELSHRTQTPHVGSALSCVDILTALYWTNPGLAPESLNSPARDRVILSKGHAATALYAVLNRRGYFPRALLERFAQPGSPVAEHPILGTVPGIEVTSGSLGHGLSLGLGMALAARLQGYAYRVYAVLSDGECNEGSVWEAAMFAPAQGLERVAVIVDYNKWQATGRSNDVLALSPLADKWRAFGWSTKEVDGHDLTALTDALGEVPNGSGRPVAIIAHTIKGKGVSCMEDDNNWHYRIPTGDEVQQARRELGLP